ncbi:MAG: M56 family metallopeptidase [Bacteroidota bacterium]
MNSLIYLFEVTICWAVFYGLYILLLRNETRFGLNRGYLMITLLLGISLPLINFSFPGGEQGQVYIGGIYSGMLAEVEVMGTTVAESGPAFSIIKFVYLGGVIICLTGLLLGFWRVGQYLRRSVIEPKSGYVLVRTPKNHAPFSFFNMMFLSSDSGMEAEDEVQVINHELAHIREKHSFDVLITELLRILFWFHPMVYFYQRSIRNTHEFLADAAVLQTTPKARYGRLLLEQSLSGPHLVNHFNKSQLKQRLTMMTKNKSSRFALAKYFLAIPVFAFCMMLFSFSNAEYPIFPEKLNEPVEAFGGEVDELPRFPGCEGNEGTAKDISNCAMNKMITYVGSNLKYPKDARKDGVEGMVVVSFIVDANGAIKKPSIAKSLSNSCDKEAMRVVASMPNWIPGKKDGKSVPVEMKLPFKFKL